ncbi:hypothetical protein EB796_004935 [Bugula neritina]|uniref:Uncharacterized protein n=1 Tax=Bugula neritina TaxID=10212 RepID=A0A7J7KDP0_BUGNE|nr:hypothetical protein EB796_004935 [Bugula neritina]
MVCAALASLDEETRYYLSSVELRNLSFVLDLIATTFEGETVALEDPRLLALFSESRTRDLLIAGLDYQVCNDGLLPAPGSYTTGGNIHGAQNLHFYT